MRKGENTTWSTFVDFKHFRPSREDSKGKDVRVAVRKRECWKTKNTTNSTFVVF